MQNSIFEHSVTHEMSDAQFRCFIYLFCEASKTGGIVDIDEDHLLSVGKCKLEPLKELVKKLVSYRIVQHHVTSCNSVYRDVDYVTRQDVTIQDKTIRNETRESVSDDTPPRVEVFHKLGLIWNDNKSEALPECKSTSGKRAKSCAMRWKENPDENYWVEVVKKISSSSFCNGKSSRGWRASFDWMLQPDTHNKVMEGKYDDNKGLISTRTQQVSSNNMSLARKVISGEV